MKTLNSFKIVAILAVLAASTASRAEAKQGGKNLLKDIIGKIGNKYTDPGHVTPLPYPLPTPHPNPRYCPPKAKYCPPTPYPSYFLGVWTSTTQIDPGYGNGSGGPVALSSQGPTIRVVPGYGQSAFGQRINRLVPQSPAARAGLEPGDIIVTANGRSMQSRRSLTWAIQNSRGQMQMLVLDGRTGQLVNVFANLETQSPNPVY